MLLAIRRGFGWTAAVLGAIHLNAHALHVRRSQTGLDRLLSQQLNRLTHFRYFRFLLKKVHDQNL